MVTEATKKHREIFAYGLLGVAALYFISGLSLLFKSGDDLGGAGFADKAALFGYLFAHPLLVIALFGAVVLVTGYGENSKNAKTIVMAGLGLAVLSLLFALVCWFAAFGADTEGSGFGIFDGVFGAGKVVGIFLGLAQLTLLGLVTFYAFTIFATFPKAVPAQHSQWGQQQGGWGQPASQDQQGQQAWGQQDSYGQPQQGQQAWGQQDSYGQPQQGQQAWGQQDSYGQPQQDSYGQPQQDQQAWGAAGTGWSDQPQPEHQGQPAASWEQMSSHAPESAQPGWGQQEQPQGWQQPEQSSWGAQGEQPQAQHAHPPAAPEEAPPVAEETQVWGGPGESRPEPAGQPEEERKDDDQPPPQQGGWWQQPNQ